MNITTYVRRVLSLLLVGLALPAFGESKSSVEKFDLLQVGTETYTNVTIIKSTATDLICFMHSRGISTVKVAELPDEAKMQLGFKVAAKPGELKAKISAQVKKLFANVDLSTVEAYGKEVSDTTTKGLYGDADARYSLLIGLGVIFMTYVVFCYCLKLICDKTGNPAGALIWLPLLQWFPMFRAAGMSPVWFLALLLPVFNLITILVWSFKITAARSKHWIVAVLFILPVTNLFAFLYLALADGGKSAEEENPKGNRRAEIMTLETA